MLQLGLLLQEIFRSRPAESFLTPLRVACHQPHWFPSVATEHPIWAVFCVRLPETQPNSTGCYGSLWMPGQRGQPSNAIADRSATAWVFYAQWRQNHSQQESLKRLDLRIARHA